MSTAYTLAQIANIIIRRPNKKRIIAAQKLNKNLMLQIHGVGMKNALKRMDFFENEDIYRSRKEYATSNVDLWARLLQEESQIFATKGGSQYFNLPESAEKKMNARLQDVIFGMSLRKWVEKFGIEAYRADPMGVIFIEVDRANPVTDEEGATAAIIGAKVDPDMPKCYPVYKCIQDVWDYPSGDGRRLDYMCFILTDDELEMYGISKPDALASGQVGESGSVYDYSSQLPANAIKTYNEGVQKKYFRFVDGYQDIIVERVSNTGENASDKLVVITLNNGVPNPVINLWGGKVPGFIISDLIKFSDPGSFDTPVNKIYELGAKFLNSRSVKDLQELYHGFAKAVEPLLTCAYCGGEGFLKGKPCPECTIPGTDKGTGYKLHTKVSDVWKIPLKILNKDLAPSFDFSKISGYITPDIASNDMQVANLDFLEKIMYYTYWGVMPSAPSGYNGAKVDKERTAMEIGANLQPKYARLNTTADWAEQFERMVADLMGWYEYREQWKGAVIRYSRDYIFETTDSILATYYDMKANGVPDSMLDNQYEKYIKALWQSQPGQAVIYQTKFDVEPFPHTDAIDVESSPFITEIDKVCKRYFSEWDDTRGDTYWTFTAPDKARADLLAYATDKQKQLDDDKQKSADFQTKNAPPSPVRVLN